MTPFRVRAAEPRDIPALMRLKRLLAEGEDSAHAVCASEADWLRDGFGPECRLHGFCRRDRGGTALPAISSGWRPAAGATSPAGTAR